jgi:flagellar protein FlbD
MIWVTRLNGSEIVVNADLIETMESTPDTVLTLVDGKKYVVQEAAADVVQRIQAYRASILRIVETPPAPPANNADLYLLPGAHEEG